MTDILISYLRRRLNSADSDLICSFSSMPLGSKSIKVTAANIRTEDEMTDKYACGDVARMPTSFLRRVLRWPNGKR